MQGYARGLFSFRSATDFINGPIDLIMTPKQFLALTLSLFIGLSGDVFANIKSTISTTGLPIEGAFRQYSGVNRIKPVHLTKEKRQHHGWFGKKKPPKPGKQKFSILALVGFAFSVTGLFVVGYLLGPVGAIMCIAAINKIKKREDQTGTWLAILGLVIGVLAFFGWIIYLNILRSQ
ncbi:MAG: DUF4190 domain-containing protein [Lewinellaceae bacterium]|nr:DUF4190 domain-containing protein [Saprospiraceae bacterium]MCB9330678.1 DUF4190 domain-containing protein [Lewinellaceae bacterium]